MLERLTDRVSNALRHLQGKAKLSEENISEALQEVRSALLSADVHFKVTKDFIERVKESCVGQDVTKTVSPGQQVIKIINDELVKLLGEGDTGFTKTRPATVLMVGLHGSGKTTSSAKLARFLQKENGAKPFLVACDVYRPAAIDQLEFLAKQENFSVFSDRTTKDVSSIAKRGAEAAKAESADLIIYDTAGRLQIDEDLIEEIKTLKKTVQPDEILLVGDSALGQEAVNVAKHFHEALGLTGIILTKLDGDARGGAALSMKSITGVPIKFMGSGEKVEDFELFHPDRIASRILGMGDVVSLVEKAQENISEAEAERMAEKMRKAEFDFEDMLGQFKQIKKMGSLGSIMGMLPGMSGMKVGENEEKQMAKTEAIILSMTKYERRNPRVLNGSRRQRIANGSGATLKDVNQLVKQHQNMKKMMKQLGGGKKNKKMMKRMQAMSGGEGGMPEMPDLSSLGGGLPDGLPGGSAGGKMPDFGKLFK